MSYYLRATDLSRIPDDIVSLYNDGTEIIGELVYEPPEFSGPLDSGLICPVVRPSLNQYRVGVRSESIHG